MTAPRVNGTANNCTATPALPPGILLNPVNCSIYGTPRSSSNLTEYRIKSADGKTTTIRIQIVSRLLQVSFAKSSYSYSVGETVDIRSILTSGIITECKITPALPQGLTFNKANCNISGTSSTKLDSTTYTITAYNGSISKANNLTLSILSILSMPAITTNSVSPMLIEKNTKMTNVTFTNSGSAITSCSVTPSLPTGLIINELTCEISGTPTSEVKLKTYTITAKNAAGEGTYLLDLRVFAYSGLSPDQVTLIINDNDPYSVAVGEYYRVKRNIPSANIIHLNFPVKTQMTRTEFASIKSTIDLNIKSSTQVIAIAWLAPSRVECNSITSAISLGFMKGPCDAGGVYPTCGIANRNPYYNSSSKLPFTDFGFRPSMLLAASNVSTAKAMIDKGVLSDLTNPTGTAHIMKTTDNTRSLRANMFPAANLGTTLNPKINVLKTLADSVSNTTNTLFYFQGLQSISNLSTNTFPPGAVADHLTSYGGMLTDSSQMSILNFITAGVTGSFGTVSEPCAISDKFPDPSIMISQYTSGLTLIESYWKSVAQTFQGLFIGDPLANPWKKIIPTLNGVCGSANNTVVSIQPAATAMCSAGASASLNFSVSTNKWTWSCNGTGGGTNSTCSATK